MKKTTKKKTSCASKCKNITGDNIKEKIHEVADDLGDLINKAKKKYDKADPETKKKVIAGVAGAGALLASIIGAKALKKKKKK